MSRCASIVETSRSSQLVLFDSYRTAVATSLDADRDPRPVAVHRLRHCTGCSSIHRWATWTQHTITPVSDQTAVDRTDRQSSRVRLTAPAAATASALRSHSPCHHHLPPSTCPCHAPSTPPLCRCGPHCRRALRPPCGLRPPSTPPSLSSPTRWHTCRAYDTSERKQVTTRIEIRVPLREDGMFRCRWMNRNAD